jgi:Leucine-rich repeat (LRR) protein
LKNLKVVQIDPSGLLEISSDIENLTKLTSLEITKSQLTTIPKEIGKLHNLRVLSISWGGQLESIPKEIGNLKKLEKLDLWRNNLTSLPSTIKNLKNLKQLRLGENNFSLEEQSRIRELLPKCEVIFEF